MVIGFMMVFMILFSNLRNFNDFPGPLVSVIDMMLGELEFREVYYPSVTKINLNITDIGNNQSVGTGELYLADKFQQFPGMTLSVKRWRCFISVFLHSA